MKWVDFFWACVVSAFMDDNEWWIKGELYSDGLDNKNPTRG